MTKEYAASIRDRYLELFREIQEGAEHCNNVSSLRSFADKADALKLRLLTEMDSLDAQLNQKKAMEEAGHQAETAGRDGAQASPMVEEPKLEYKVRRTKNVSIKKMTGTASWRLESAEDVEEHIAKLRRTLLEQLDEDTIVNVEF